MGELDIKLNPITTAINELNNLKRICDAAKKAPPTTVGGGKTVNELEEIGKQYQTINGHLSLMISSTIMLMKKTRNEFETSDKRVATKISKR